MEGKISSSFNRWNLNKFLENFCQILLIKISNFTVSEDVFSTYNPSSMEVTNSWKLSDVVGMTPTNSTVRKVKKFCAILREINFSHFKSYKVPFLLIWRLWMLFFGEFQISKNARNQQNQNLVSVNAEFAVFDILEFHKLFSRKIWGAEKCSNLRIVRGRV